MHVSRRKAVPAFGIATGLLLIGVLALTGAVMNDSDPASAQAQQPVPPEVAQNQDQWPLPNKDYANTRATADSNINSGSVSQLGVAWTFPIPGVSSFGAATSNPIVQDDVVYFQDTQSNIFALDLQSGNVLWEHRYGNSIYGPNGVAVGWGKVFGAKGILEVAALDKQNGQELWTTQLDGPTGSFQPTIYNGMLFATDVAAGLPEDPSLGAAGMRFYAPGAAGRIYALDQQNGNILWRFSTVEEGFWGHPEINSGGGVWFAPAIDMESGLAYFGTGNPGPFPGIVGFPNGSSRPGDNLYTNSLVALDYQSGEMEWYHQVVPHDLFDLDNQNPPILATLDIEGQQRDIVIGSGKHGRVLAYDRHSGEVLWETEVGRHLNDNVQEIPEDINIPVYPGTLGGIEVPGAYSDGVVYMPVVNLRSLQHPTGYGAQNGTEAFQNTITRGPAYSDGTGDFAAIDVRTGVVLWQHRLPSINLGGATVVNDLVFTATYDGVIYAYNKNTGEQVWTAQAPAGINAWPAVVGDTIIWPAGVGNNPVLVAYRLGAPGEVQPPGGQQPTPTPPPPQAQSQQQVRIEISAENIQFSTNTITVPAGAHVVMPFTNNDSVPHNVAVYQTEQAQQSIFVGEVFTGPNETRTYEFDAPSQPGTYFFRCDIHPLTMTGDFIVE